MKKLFLSTVLLLSFFISKAQKTEIDKRALNYYTQEQISEMPDVKIKQVNFLYQQSFIIPEENIKKINPQDINIIDFNQSRLPNERAKVYLSDKNSKEGSENPELYFYLLSIEELQQAYKNIK
jgi:hypothetical protein